MTTKPKHQKPPTLSIPEVVARVGVSSNAVRARIRSGKLVAHLPPDWQRKPGGGYRVNAASVAQWQAERATEARRVLASAEGGV